MSIFLIFPGAITAAAIGASMIQVNFTFNMTQRPYAEMTKSPSIRCSTSATLLGSLA